MLAESFIYDDQDKYLTLKGFLDQEGMEHYTHYTSTIAFTITPIWLLSSIVKQNQNMFC